METTSALLEVSKETLVKSITEKTTKTGHEDVLSLHKLEKSYDVRDALVKGIYSRLFAWIVRKINRAINNEPVSRLFKNVGVLDIFGFEIFDKNSFEQFCINFANEHLQQFFVRHIFKLEQQEYNNESINWRHIEFTDNQNCLELLGQKPMNLFALLDEESKFPRGTNHTYLEKISYRHSNNILFKKPKNNNDIRFTLTHFAGDVTYDCDSFIEKNRDTFSSDLLSMIKNSRNDLLIELFRDEVLESRGHVVHHHTLGSQFRKSLDSLMKTLQQCQPWFVRCIKPNDHKGKQNFDRILVCRQLRYSGIES